MISIVQRDDPVLREHAADVPPAHIPTPQIQKIIRDMKTALHEQDDGVAIAAPQIGVPLRIFVVSGRAFDLEEDEDELPAPGETKHHDLVFINPVITRLSKKRRWLPEGCLSVRWLYGKVLRSEKATVRAYDETGKSFTRGASGLLAQIFQHETDHLDGVLFTDKARDVEHLEPERIKKARG